MYLNFQSSSLPFLFTRFWNTWEVASRTLFLMIELFCTVKVWQCWDASHSLPTKSLYTAHSLGSEKGVIGVGWGPDLTLLSLQCALFPLALHSENWRLVHPLLGVSLGFSYAPISSLHTSADHQRVPWSLPPKRSVCCVLCSAGLTSLLATIIYCLEYHESSLTFLPASRLTSSIQSLFYRVNFLKHNCDPITPVVEISLISSSFTNWVIHTFHSLALSLSSHRSLPWCLPSSCTLCHWLVSRPFFKMPHALFPVLL